MKFVDKIQKLLSFSSFNVKKDFKAMLVLVLALLVIVPLIGGGAYISINSTNLIKKNIYLSNEQLIGRINDDIKFNLDSIANQIQSMADNPNIKSMNHDEMQSILIQGAKSNEAIDGISISDAKGQIIYNTAGVYKNISREEYFQNAISGKIGYSKVKISEINSKPLEFYYSAPVKMGTNIVGCVTATIDVNSLSKIINDVQKNKNDITFIVDNNGMVVAHKDWSNFNRVSMYRNFPPVKEVIANKSGQGTYDFNNSTLLAIYSPMSNLKWGILTIVPYDVAFSDVKAQNDVFLAIVVFMLIVSILVALLISQFVTNPLCNLNIALDAVSTGNLMAGVEEKFLRRQDQLGEIAKNFNGVVSKQLILIDKVKGMIKDVQSSNEDTSNQVDELILASKNVSTAMGEIANGTVEQTSYMSIIVDRFSTLKKSLDNINTSTNKIVNYTRQTKDKNQRGIVSATELKEEFKKNYESIQSAASNIKDLSDKSKSIGTITDSIKSIAEQTNLLALNAAIEASRAGEAGKGFAVVADEVRKLAEQSSDSAREIQDIITEIGVFVNKIGKEFVNTTQIAERSNDKLETTIEIFESIINNSDELIKDIEFLYEEMYKMKNNEDEVDKCVDNTSSIIEQGSATTEEVNATMEEQLVTMEKICNKIHDINNKTRELQEFVEFFKTEA
ncbi:MAG: methyl-accepting chemotaxis protein [Clostridium sp.]|jgi:methyl-accepting chemotaxis protein|uniref:methyl-accepting chemotaxis protein n=1 Tax=Clostridium sp. TaxID=1506 RepID=UPI0025BB7F3D|nr:methyl-accepting chemotaxis protein [Clostridium sp.]MCH3963613.1 methyl-accepting chemotaxis protein [Clostridium sp.]MCI1714754.1 methyl-accepting chemotaxis protein [Clostridium sp.]MCI1799057.1 methyl-accepting chemotaxis protein [Clostridium sp.]MCI1812937.1 methyl-accepting chemotaxis protein [Clostridium sp.]MCI1869827.1 methyl-accepting chemotaxis protein [Clostridium sp.]